jgi:hypothetical protein
MISDAFTLRDATITLPTGATIVARRPSALDMVEAHREATERPETIGAWLVWRHLRHGDAPMFATMEEVLRSDGRAVAAAAAAIEQLYGEGRD